ncbi:MAG: hypothetical protein GEV13_30715 [Rhodospirillales bacterium]|nr:hypothetical protein [Rhodospirillales bacterium]
MRLLFDQNLSHKLVKRLADVFPDSLHVLALRFVLGEHVRMVWVRLGNARRPIRSNKPSGKGERPSRPLPTLPRKSSKFSSSSSHLAREFRHFRPISGRPADARQAIECTPLLDFLHFQHFPQPLPGDCPPWDRRCKHRLHSRRGLRSFRSLRLENQ